MGTRPRARLPPAASSVWVLNFMEERFHDMSPGDCESTFIAAGEGEVKEEL